VNYKPTLSDYGHITENEALSIFEKLPDEAYLDRENHKIHLKDQGTLPRHAYNALMALYYMHDWCIID